MFSFRTFINRWDILVPSYPGRAPSAVPAEPMTKLYELYTYTVPATRCRLGANSAEAKMTLCCLVFQGAGGMCIFVFVSNFTQDQ